MPDLGRYWPAVPDWNVPPRPWGIETRLVSGVGQFLVSGDLEAWSRSSHIGIDRVPSCDGDYAVRIARDRVMAVTTNPGALRSGWNGCAITDVSGGALLLEISGAHLSDLMSRATTLPRLDASPGAAIRFAGLDTIGYVTAGKALRLHIDRSLSTHFWSWLEALDRLHASSPVSEASEQVRAGGAGHVN